jgi:hypothetical protein
MTMDDEVHRKDKGKYVAFILSQLRDDLDDLVTGLESGAITPDTAVAGAKVQLQSGLNLLVKLD